MVFSVGPIRWHEISDVPDNEYLTRRGVEDNLRSSPRVAAGDHHRFRRLALFAQNTIPLALVGAVWALFITGTTINVVAFIGVLSALMALQLERGKEYAVLRALGLTRGQIAGLISGESLLMGLLAACVALPVGILMAWVLIESVQRRAFGWTMPFSVDPVLLAQTLLVGLLAAGLAALYPAWRSAHSDPAPQLREE